MPMVLHAYNVDDNIGVHPVFGVEAGVGIFTNAGQSQTFLAGAASGSDEFYIYTSDNDTKIPALYGGFVGIEWRRDTNWRFLFDLNYNQSSSFSVGGILSQGIDSSTTTHYLYEYDMRVRQLLAEVKFEYEGAAQCNPYLVAGLGASFNQADHFETTVSPSVAFTRMYADNNSTASFTYALGVGVDYKPIDRVRLGISYKFSDLGKMALGAATIDDISVPGTLTQSHVYVNEFLILFSVAF